MLFETLILTVLLHGAGSWGTLKSSEVAILSAAYHGMACYMLRPQFTYEQAMHLSRSRVLALLGLPSIPTLLHVARLRHLLSCLATGVPVMWAILHWHGHWLDSARSSIAWLWEHTDHGASTSCWRDAWVLWKEWCLHQPRRWKGLIRNAQAQAIRQEHWLSSERHHSGLICRQLRQAGAFLPSDAPSLANQQHFCAPCLKRFATYQAWSVHAFKSHGHTAEHRQVQGGTQCQACLRHFTTHIRLCRHLQYNPLCRSKLREAGYGCRVEPGVGNKRAPDEGKFQAPSLQAQGPLLPLLGFGWAEYLDRPAIEVLECLSHISFGLGESPPEAHVAWERARAAFSSVCLPIRKIRATAREWASIVGGAPTADVFPAGTLLHIAQWILTADLADWLVPQPVGGSRQVCTFRDVEEVLPELQVAHLPHPTLDFSPDWTLVRIGAPGWLAARGPAVASSVDFTHEECLQAFEEGGLPSFMEDVSNDAVFVISVCGLPMWNDCPISPVRQKTFGSQLTKALLAGDLLRFALRLWLLGVPAALCTDRHEAVPAPVMSLPFLDSPKVGWGTVWCTKAFDWEPFLFHLIN
ncbi:unnamed protein product [Symbiodinium necroappetens]|uniref:C2H2-type domain-containing protein n=1 Tax=Symbiodinium necroappetens TaxID=1628268 RepID=A0A813BRK6_9DINO|nr:unnamed protein product [Symbiodinium necroappetens]